MVIGLAIVLFLCMILGFVFGLKLGMQTAKGKEPVIKGPVKMYQESKANAEAKKEEEKMIAGIDAIMSYTGDIKKE